MQRSPLKQQNAMLAWLDGDVDDKERLAPKYDGTLGSLADCYESDEDSAYQELKENSAEVYKAWLKMVRETVGLRNVSRIVAKDFRRWYRMWEERSTSRGTDGTRQAYGGIQIIRIILNFGSESGIKKCLELRMAMDNMKFRRNPPRNLVLTYAQVRAFLEEAWRLGELFTALVQAIQFEFFLRQNDVIGQWRKIKPGYIAREGDVIIGEKYWPGLRASPKPPKEVCPTMTSSSSPDTPKRKSCRTSTSAKELPYRNARTPRGKSTANRRPPSSV
jgi:hypothetical protein